ncbi:MAG TPA: hypothetical protein VN673_00250 [Clostridia bacterium]|nr:hypothetical protein [Clostridia bacterium]
MKKSPLTRILLGVLTLSTLASLAFCAWYIMGVRNLKTLQPQVVAVQNNRALINALVAETMEYSKRNPAIDPLLESAGLKGKPGAPAQPAPSPRPATK